MSENPWYTTYFGEDYSSMYDVLPPERTVWEVQSVVKRLALPPGSSILDLCCGHGRHTIPLAKRGYQVTGQDLSEVLLRQAQAEAETQGVRIRWIPSDMRNIAFENEFDAVINLYSSFGYLENEDEDRKVLQQVQQALKPGGLFLLETIHREALLRYYTPHEIRRLADGLIVLEERNFDLLNSRSNAQLTLLHADGRRTAYRHSVRVYTLTELVQMLADAELYVQGYYGGLDGRELSLTSLRQILLSRKA
jgi:SAM-dependent methyltransferase